MENELKITFRQKNPTTCPVCHHEFYREELFTGRGRLIAGDLTDELRRTYQENSKFGTIYPLIYTLTVCPDCYYTSYQEDFSAPIKDVKTNLLENKEERKNRINQLFPNINFDDDRTLIHGAASYILSVTCYSFFDKRYAPTLKKAFSSIRASWVLQDLTEETKDHKFGYIRDIFYKKSAYFYQLAVEYSQTGKEIIDNVKNYGPDIDKNFGYDGMLYMASLLNYKMGFLQKDPEIQAEIYIKSKRTISKLFGLGKASKDKPTAILDMAKDLFTQINDRLKGLEEVLGRSIS